jgi:predicted homoserine dehydrogenase-like protein
VLDGEGGYTVFGKLIGAEESLAQGCLPLGLTGGAKVTRPVAKGEYLTYTDVSLDPSGAAHKLRKQMEKGEVG